MDKHRIRLILADDHPVFRKGLETLLREEASLDVMDTASDGEALVQKARRLRPDVILTDLRMPEMDGIAAIRIISNELPATKLVALSTFDNEYLISQALEAGAFGYVLKTAEKHEIVDAIQTVFAGDPYYCRSTSKRLARLVAQSQFDPYHPKVLPKFSEKERQVIRLICEEKLNKEIAETMQLTIKAIEYYRSNIMEKMKVMSVAGIAIYAAKTFLFEPDREES